jgi:REP element-mobilizing transposase RayT
MARGARQAALQFLTWGGVRVGAGRPPKGRAAGVSHLQRPAVSVRHPLHVTLKVRSGLPSLRGALFPRVQVALARARERFGFRLAHFSVQRDHLHLIVEAEDRRSLSRGMQGLCVRVARAVNRAVRRRGSLFADRYHARALASPRTLRMALRYVLLNARKHGRSQVAPGFVDECSSAAWFREFLRPAGLAFGAEGCRRRFAQLLPELEAPVAQPQSWLLRVGFLRAGPFDVDEVPGAA